MGLVTFDDLVDAYFSAARFQDAVPELRDYHVKKRNLMQELYGCSLDVPRKRLRTREERAAQYDLEVLVRMCRACLEQSVALASPFGFYLEGGPGPMERTLRDEYKRTFEACSSALAGQYRAIFRHALGAIFPKATTLTFSWATLFERGLSREVPDPHDFW